MTAPHENHAALSPDIRCRLARSRASVGQRPERTIRCPNCGFHLLDVYGYDHCLVRVKCRKCKFCDVIDTALFRTVRSRRQEISLTGETEQKKNRPGLRKGAQPEDRRGKEAERNGIRREVPRLRHHQPRPQSGGDGRAHDLRTLRLGDAGRPFPQVRKTACKNGGYSRADAGEPGTAEGGVGDTPGREERT